MEREPRVDDVLDDQDVAIGDRGVQVLEDPDDARRSPSRSRSSRPP